MADEAGTDNLNFLRTARAPGKRQVKVSSKPVLDSDLFGLSASDDEDVDFKPKSVGEDSDEEYGEDQHDSSNEASEDESDEENESDEETENEDRSANVTPSSDGGPADEATDDETGGTIVICCICLNRRFADREVMLCDCCGLSVHEDCYGTPDVESIHSDSSSLSTEPWFCEPCLAGVSKPFCELCPRVDGAFKRTNVGRWVHVLCALYTPGITFGDTDALNRVSLFDVNPELFGSKECAICENSLYARCGICIRCDAGMCKQHFHVTCAQKHGLLCETSYIDSDEKETADPYYARCKAHSDRHQVKARQIAVGKVSKLQREMTVREEKRLRRCRDAYGARLKSIVPEELPYKNQKWQRLLSTSFEFLTKMRKKQALALGVDEFQLEKAAAAKSGARLDADEIRRAFVGKTVMPPSFSAEFVSYFVERENHLATQQKDLEKFQQKLAKYRNEDSTWNGKYEEVKCEHERVSESHKKCQKQLTNFYECMKALGCSKLPSDAATLAAALKAPSKAKLVEDSIFHVCKTCNQSTDQHLMAHCDSCNNFYHIGCLDPPLTKLPRKTSLYGWECASCCHSTSSDDGSIELNAPRQLRSERKRTSRLVDETLGDSLPRKRGRPKIY